MHYYFIPLGYDCILDVTGQGTITRCNALLKQAHALYSQASPIGEPKCTFIATAGFSKSSPTKPNEDAPESLAKQIANYIRSRGSWQVIAVPLAWGTYPEIKEALGMILRYQLTSDNTGLVQIYISTNFGHMPRVKMCCWFIQLRTNSLLLKKAKILFVCADHSFTRKERVQEIVKFFVYFYRLTFGEWRH